MEPSYPATVFSEWSRSPRSPLPPPTPSHGALGRVSGNVRVWEGRRCRRSIASRPASHSPYGRLRLPDQGRVRSPLRPGHQQGSGLRRPDGLQHFTRADRPQLIRGPAGVRRQNLEDPLAGFEPGPNPFRDGPYAGRIRHVALVKRGARLHVFFTGIGDAPERVMLSTIDLGGEWTAWKATDPVEVLQPETGYECTDHPNRPSEAGDIAVPVRQIRDPFVFEEDGRAYLFYSICGEQGVAAAEITGLGR